MGLWPEPIDFSLKIIHALAYNPNEREILMFNLHICGTV